MSASTKVSIYQRVTTRIIEALERGVVPWRKPWISAPHRNAITRLPYRGVNILQLELTQYDRGFRCSSWATFRQAEMLGGHVRQGERGTAIVWYERRPKHRLDAERADQEVDQQWVYLARCYHVFNLEQCAGLDELRDSLDRRNEFVPIEECERVLLFSGAQIENGGSEAFYEPGRDRIVLPVQASFDRAESYYATAFHELIHWTGAPSRLDRSKIGRFGDPVYAFEELVAELGSAFVCGHCGIEQVSDAAAYVGSWLRALQGDVSFVFKAASAAAKAADLLIPRSTAAQEPTAEVESSLTDQLQPAVAL